MKILLAPTRGGEASYPNQDLAIRLAKENGARLFFLYVSDVRFLGSLSVSYLEDLERNLADMGEFLLTMAQERAEKAGYSAEIVVRRGNFGAALRNVISDIGATHVLIGAPTRTGLTDWDYLNDLTGRLVNELGVGVYIADAGKIVAERHPADTD
jgi:nucleotide-binding universal stress UspA family protein